MRPSTLVSALFVAGALSSPLVQKRGYVTEIDVVTVTAYVTEVLAASTTSAIQSYQAPSSSSAPSTSSEAPAPTSSSVALAQAQAQAQAPSSKAPAPAPSSEAPAPAPAPSSSSSAAPAPSPVAQSIGTDYNSRALYHHNIHRANHSAVDLKWDDNLASSAQEVASSCVYAHNVKAGGGGYGQNIGAGPDADHVGGVITTRFYNDEMELFKGLYGKASPDMSNFENWGHFSQVVWKDTKSVGCYTQACPNGLENVGEGVGKHFTVCNYSPPGNFVNDYTKVGSPEGNAYVSSPLY